MMTSKRSLIGAAVLFAIGATAACGGDDSAPGNPSSTAGAPGSSAGAGNAPAMGGAPSAGAPAMGGAPSAGAPAMGGAPSAGAPAMGGAPSAGAAGSMTAGSGGASAGTGGAAGGASGGAAGGASGGGGNTPTFAQVSSLLATSCAGMMCHGAGTSQAKLAEMGGLYDLLTKPLTDAAHCKGETLVTPGNADASFLLKVIQGKSTCKNGNGTEMIVRMPDDCPSKRECLTADKIKLVSDWIAGGAPQ